MALLWGACWVAFLCSGVAIHRACLTMPSYPRYWIDLIGYDSEGLITIFYESRHVFTCFHRHPLFPQLCFPVFLVASVIGEIFGTDMMAVGVIGCFAAVGATAVLLLVLTLRRLGVCAAAIVGAVCFMLSCAHVWILGGAVESFSLSHDLFIGMLMMVAYRVHDWRAWSAMTLCAGGVTVTNVIKPVIAWLVSVPRTVRAKQPVAQIIYFGCLIVLGICGYTCIKWMCVDRIGIDGGFRIFLNDAMKYSSMGTLTFGDRLWYSWNAFWCEPFMLHGTIFNGSIVNPYLSFIPHVAGAITLVACCVSAVMNRKMQVVRVLLLCVACDVALHLVVGWGIMEGQIYCGHWIAAVPVLLALLPRPWHFITYPLSFFLLAHNLAVVIGHFTLFRLLVIGGW